jgi:hypothetical protein
MSRKISSDIDLDFGDRNAALNFLWHTPASQYTNGELVKHNSGVYVTLIPQDEILGISSFDYKKAEELGYVKLDFLNNHIYSLIKSNDDLDQLLKIEPPWHKLTEQDFVKQVAHIGNYFNMIQKLSEPIDSIEKLAMFLAIIRPAKKHLIGKTWNEIRQTVWDKSTDGTYGFKKPHSLSYATLIGVQMVLLSRQPA